MEDDHQHQHQHHHHHRLSLKKKNTSTTTMNWKHKLRDNCFNRIQADRDRLLWKLRTSSSSSSSSFPPHEKDLMDVTFRDIVSDELNKIKNSDADVDIWEYHAFQTHSHTECEDILIEMQRIFYEDLRASQHTTTEQDDYEGTWEEEDDYLAKLVFDQLQLKTDQICNNEVWCPICKQGELKEDHRLIYCTRCKLQLSRGDEVNVEILRARLAEAHSDHLEGGCMLAPKFCMETRFNLTALYIQCEACSIFEIVL